MESLLEGKQLNGLTVLLEIIQGRTTLLGLLKTSVILFISVNIVRLPGMNFRKPPVVSDSNEPLTSTMLLQPLSKENTDVRGINLWSVFHDQPNFHVHQPGHLIRQYPSLVLKPGPLIRLWTMPFESKYSFFKRCARHLTNVQNICLFFFLKGIRCFRHMSQHGLDSVYFGT